MKLKLLFLSLMCLNQIDIHCGEEAYPDAEHYDKMSLQILAQIDAGLSADEKKEFEALSKEVLALRKQNTELQKLLNYEKYASSRTQANNAALQIALKQANDATALAQANYVQAQNNFVGANNSALAWKNLADGLHVQLDTYIRTYVNPAHNSVAVTTFPLMVASN